VGWQDRDWAKWTEDERSRFLGGHAAVAPGAFLAVVVSLVVLVVARPQAVAVLHFGRSPAAPSSVVYGTGTAYAGTGGTEVTCVGLWVTPETGSHCSSWVTLLPGQRAVAAAAMPPTGTCAIIQADQSSGRWICRGVAAGTNS